MREYKNERMVDGKTLNQIAEETGIKFKTLETRYHRGIRNYEEITKPVLYKNDNDRLEWATIKGKKVLEASFRKRITLQQLCKRSGVSRCAVEGFLYYDTDISAMRLAKICSVVGVSMDYVMGLKR